jgi:chromosome segregation ATPase
LSDVSEYDSIDQTLDQLNVCLDELENKNDNLRARIQEFLASSRQYRLEKANDESTLNTQSGEVSAESVATGESPSGAAAAQTHIPSHIADLLQSAGLGDLLLEAANLSLLGTEISNVQGPSSENFSNNDSKQQ